MEVCLSIIQHKNTWIFSKCKSYIHEHTTIFEDVTNRFHETLDNIQSFVPFKIRTVGSFLKENPGMHQISFHVYVFMSCIYILYCVNGFAIGCMASYRFCVVIKFL